jgi:hypothetical protein
MPKHCYPAVVTALIATLFSMSMTAAFAKQQCSASSSSHGYWSWRLIDGRKCWYEGKPMLAKSSLEWSARTTARSDSDEKLVNVNAPTEKPGNPLDAQARATDPETFDALWRARIDRH